MMANDGSLLHVEKNNTTIILNGSSYSFPSLDANNAKSLQLRNIKFDGLSNVDLVGDSGILLETGTRGACRFYYLPVKDDGQLGDVELQQNSVDRLSVDSVGCKDDDDSNNLFNMTSELVKTQLQIPDNVVSSQESVSIKRKGGWPKGKKRKKPVEESKAPKAPTTGYVRFLNERRACYKEIHPEIPFVEVTRLLGSEWSNMALEEKQKYLDEAEADKKRYREELRAYQQSDAYQEYMKRKQLKVLENSTLDCETTTINPATLQEIDDEDSDELYCKACDQFFNSLHNKKEHLYGRHHLQNVTGNFQKEATCTKSHESEDDSLAILDADAVFGSTSSIPSLPTDHVVVTHHRDQTLPTSPPVNVTEAINNFIALTIERSAEIDELRRNLRHLKDQNSSFTADVFRYQELKDRMEGGLKNLKMVGLELNSQLENLRMIPTLFRVINF